MTDLATPSPSPASLPAAAPAPSSGAAANPQQSAQGQPSVHVHLSPELVRMAGLPAQAAAPVAQPAAEPAKTLAPVGETPKPADAPRVDDKTAALEARVADLDARYRATLIRAEVDRVALVAGAIDPAVVHQLLAGELDVSGDGKVIAKGDPRVTGEQHVARFLASKPFLLKPAVPGGGSGAPSNVVPITGTVPLNLNDNASVTAHANARAKAMGFAR